MRIISKKNLEKIAEINTALANAGMNKKILIQFIDNDTQLGIRLELPPLYLDGNKPYIVSMTQEKERDSDLETMVTTFNLDVKDLLDTVANSYYKMIRIKEATSPVKDDNVYCDYYIKISI